MAWYLHFFEELIRVYLRASAFRCSFKSANKKTLNK